MAIAKQQKRGAEFGKANSIDFHIIDVSDSMGWESGPVKRELKQLEFNNDHPGQSGTIPVEVYVL